ncbi:MAG TPA: hypothetical protein ENG50_02205 [Candidatus Altiarchaeales archaeon]|nr:hypothetical protein [Candidatus Altiarchaeales archaeon]
MCFIYKAQLQKFLKKKLKNGKNIYKELKGIKQEIKNLKILLAFHEQPFKLVSLRGMGKLLVSEHELEDSIEEAKRSLFKHVSKSPI